MQPISLAIDLGLVTAVEVEKLKSPGVPAAAAEKAAEQQQITTLLPAKRRRLDSKAKKLAADGQKKIAAVGLGRLTRARARVAA